MKSISKQTWNKLNSLSSNKLKDLADLMNIGFLNEPEDKAELVLLLSTESESKVLKAIKKLTK